jgi:hypothetical protein
VEFQIELAFEVPLLAYHLLKFVPIELFRDALTFLNEFFEVHFFIFVDDFGENSSQQTLRFAGKISVCAVAFGQFSRSAFIECIEQ